MPLFCYHQKPFAVIFHSFNLYLPAPDTCIYRFDRKGMMEFLGQKLYGHTLFKPMNVRNHSWTEFILKALFLSGIYMYMYVVTFSGEFLPSICYGDTFCFLLFVNILEFKYPRKAKLIFTSPKNVSVIKKNYCMVFFFLNGN